MKIRNLVVTATIVLAALASRASTIPYPNVGTIAPIANFTADVTEDITGYFVGGGRGVGDGAADTDYVKMLDLTSGTNSGWVFNNQTTAKGTSVDLGFVTAGDVLQFDIWNQTLAVLLSSTPAASADGVNHAYATTWAGGNLNGTNILAGTYIGFEDEPNGISDFNYSDDMFVVNDDSYEVAVTPEPSSFYLLGTGLVALAQFGRRKLRA